MNNYPYNYKSVYNSGYNNNNSYTNNQYSSIPNQNGYNRNNYNQNNQYNNNNNYTPNNNMSSSQKNIYNNYNNNNNLNNSNNYNKNQKPQNIIQLDEAISRSKYPKFNHDFIKNYIIDTFSENPEVKIYLYDQIFVVEYEMKLVLSTTSKSYKLNLLLYIPELFPDYEPELYVKNKGGSFSLNSCYENSINQNTLRINMDSFRKYDKIKKNIEEVIEAIRTAFNENFPVYGEKTKKNNYVGKCCINYSDSVEVEIPKQEKYTEEDILNIMRMKTKELIIQKYNNSINNLNIINDYNELNQMNNLLKTSLNTYNQNENNYQINQEMSTLNEINQKLKNVENNLKNEVALLKEKQANFLGNCENDVKFTDDEIAKLTVMKKAIEDYLSFLRKGFEKKKVSMQECIKQTRELSSKLFNINFLMNKRKEENK